MRRSSILISFVAVFGALMPLGCLQDFGAFEPTASSGTGGMTTSTTGTGGTGGMTSSSGTGGMGGMGGMTTSSTGTGAEDCTNGKDDDNDGDIDCADSDCTTAGYSCFKKLPTGWNGPYALYEGATGMIPASCPAEFPSTFATGNSDLDAPAATCNTCSCTSPTVTCTPGSIAAYTVDTCPGGGTAVAQDGTCQAVGTGAKAFKASAPTAAQMGMCTATGGGVASKPQSKWNNEDRICGDAMMGGGCTGATSCAPPAPTGALLCVARQGDQTCPAEFPNKHVIYTNPMVTDTRDCAACSCNVTGTPSCTATTSLYSTADCSGTAVKTVPNDSTCVTEATAVSLKVTTTPNTLTCTATTTPTGAVTPDNSSAITVCCSN